MLHLTKSLDICNNWYLYSISNDIFNKPLLEKMSLFKSVLKCQIIIQFPFCSTVITKFPTFPLAIFFSELQDSYKATIIPSLPHCLLVIFRTFFHCVPSSVFSSSQFWRWISIITILLAIYLCLNSFTSRFQCHYSSWLKLLPWLVSNIIPKVWLPNAQ